jgi:hypothetical protein
MEKCQHRNHPIAMVNSNPPSTSTSSPPLIASINEVAVQSYVTILQGVITRMATNSANCKTWCVSLASVILVLTADKNKGNASYALIALIPTFLFAFLDTYYLGQERAYREVYNRFIENLTTGKAELTELFRLKPLNKVSGKDLQKAFFSISVCPFYTAITLTVCILWAVVSFILRR